MKAQADSSSRGQKDFICREEKRRERLHGDMQGDLAPVVRPSISLIILFLYFFLLLLRFM
jgi:hypothetical protein